MSTHFDYFVIGAGSGGVRSARIAAQHGAKVGIAEGSRLGGTCVNLGCVPKKILAYASDYAAHFEDSRPYGWDTPQDIPFDWATLIKNKNAEIDRLNGIYGKLLDGSGVELFKGFAKFTGPKELDIDGQTVTADKILIAVGGTPRPLDIEGGEHAITSDDAFYLEALPKHVVIYGGGYIAVEFAHIFRGMGAKVTLVYRGNMILRGFDDTIRLALMDEMKKQGIAFCLESEINSIEKRGDNAYTAHTDKGHDIECDLVLSAIGRVPKTDNLGLEKAGIDTECNGQITIDDNYQTSVEGVYALGDVANQNNLTPVAIKEGHVLADRLFGGHEERSVNYDNIATAVFSNPPISTVGLTEEQALDAGHSVIVFKSDFRSMKYVMAERNERTIMKLIVDAETDRVLGAHMIGLDAPEIMQGFAVALNCGATKADFDRTMAMHPTSAEEFVTMRTGSEIVSKSKLN